MRMSFQRRLLALALLGGAALPWQASLAYEVYEEVSNYTVPVNKSRVFSLERPVKKIAVGNPEIADILLTHSHQVLVLGRSLGSTNVMAWDADGNLVKTFDVEVSYDFRGIKEKMHELLPNEQISVSTAQNALVLSGNVSSAQAMDTAHRIALSYAKVGKVDEKSSTKEKDNKKAGDNVVNLLSVGDSQQVMLKVQVAEVQRTLVKRWDMRFKMLSPQHWTLGGVGGGASFPDALLKDGSGGSAEFPVAPITNGMWGPAISEIQANPMNIADKGLFGGLLTETFFFQFSLDAARNSGLAKILAEPNLTTLTGQEASFISGGEFPIPVSNGLNGVTISYKDFGVGVKFLPTVLDNNRINMKLNVSVSEINSTNTVQLNVDSAAARYVIPGLSKRTSTSTVELADGQTIAIAGLINENMRDVVNKFPLLGDLPVLGPMFRSKDFQKGETELVILVTPQLAKPIDRNAVQLPTDNYVEPSDWQFYLMGKNVERRSESTSKASPQAGDASSSGRFGHALPNG